MSLRDYFAGQALAAMHYQDIADLPVVIAGDCYQIADAMLAEREREEGEG